MTYSLGHIITEGSSWAGAYPRPLIDDDTGRAIAVVDSNAGPATIGPMTGERVAELFGFRPDRDERLWRGRRMTAAEVAVNL